MINGQTTNKRPSAIPIRSINYGSIESKLIVLQLTNGRSFNCKLFISQQDGGRLKFLFEKPSVFPDTIDIATLTNADKQTIWTEISSIIATKVEANPKVIDVVLEGYVPPHVCEKRLQQCEKDKTHVLINPYSTSLHPISFSNDEIYLSAPVCLTELFDTYEYEQSFRDEVRLDCELFAIKRKLGEGKDVEFTPIQTRLNKIDNDFKQLPPFLQDDAKSKLYDAARRDRLQWEKTVLETLKKNLDEQKTQKEKELNQISLRRAEIEQSEGFHLSATRRLIEIRKQAQEIRQEAKKSFWKTLRASAATAFISSGMFGVSTGMFFNTILPGPIGFILGIVFGAAVWIGGGVLQSYANIRKARSNFEKTEVALNIIERQPETEFKTRLARIKTEADAFQIIMSVANVTVGLGATFSNPLFVMPGSSAVAIGANFATFAAIGVVTMTASVLLQMYANDESGKLSEAKRRARELSVEHALLQAQIVLEERALQATTANEKELLEKLKSTHTNLQEMWHEKRKLAAYEHEAEKLRPSFWSRLGHSSVVRGIANIIMVDIKPYTLPEKLVFLEQQISTTKQKTEQQNQTYNGEMLTILETQRSKFSEGSASRNLLDTEWTKLHKQQIEAEAKDKTRSRIFNIFHFREGNEVNKEPGKKLIEAFAAYNRSGKISSVIGGSVVGSTIGLAGGAGIVSLLGIFVLGNPFISIPALVVGGLLGLALGIGIGAKLIKESLQRHERKRAKKLMEVPLPLNGSGLATSAASTGVNVAVMVAAPPMLGQSSSQAIPGVAGVAAGVGFLGTLVDLIGQLFHRKNEKVVDNKVGVIYDGVKKTLETDYAKLHQETITTLPQPATSVLSLLPSLATDTFLRDHEHPGASASSNSSLTLPPEHSANAVPSDFTNSPPPTYQNQLAH